MDLRKKGGPFVYDSQGYGTQQKYRTCQNKTNEGRNKIEKGFDVIGVHGF